MQLEAHLLKKTKWYKSSFNLYKMQLEVVTKQMVILILTCFNLYKMQLEAKEPCRYSFGCPQFQSLQDAIRRIHRLFLYLRIVCFNLYKMQLEVSRRFLPWPPLHCFNLYKMQLEV